MRDFHKRIFFVELRSSANQRKVRSQVRTQVLITNTYPSFFLLTPSLELKLYRAN